MTKLSPIAKPLPNVINLTSMSSLATPLIMERVRIFFVAVRDPIPR